ncbi:MAG: pyruvate dehydrogenase (acetyl-transferring) E1 component subunit alpha [Planctomycetes bacterium]|nr:pyruvate dehydrogenase (acetyl-transferring) E1 component subunit alpha [Planctomycetota bacterium]MCC7398191.1 pyruvate dehydrogenase (acetyl-transferring) E1 component subunit alpha [Planctomycetota bacterium]
MSLELLTILDQDGKAQKGKDPNLPAAELQRLYRLMVATRALDDRGLALQRQGRIGFYLQSTGQEASHLGAAYALHDSDWLFPAYRQPGILLLRKVPIEKIICEWFGNAGDTSKGRQMPVHYSFRQANFVSVSSPIGTQLTQAAGAGMAARLRGDDTVFMTFCGDGGTSSNDFHTGLNFAGVYKAPVVFVCENNGYAISVPSQKQTASTSMAIKAEAYGMPGVRVDGNDILAVYRVCKEAVDRARRGEGPTLVETVTHRMASHSSSDDAARYRDAAEYEAWKKKDPIVRFQQYLQHKKLWTEAFEQECVEGAKADIAAAVKAAEATGQPAVDTLFDDVYLNLTPQLEEQRRELRDLVQRGGVGAEVGHFPL